jgi:cell division protein FtsW (lipid II flippase)
MGLLIQFRMGSFDQLDLKNNIYPLLPFAIGLGAFLIGVTLTSKGRGGWLQALGWGAYIAAVGVLVAMLVLGRSYRGGIYLSGNINPTEIVKPLLVFFLATHLSQRQKEFSETLSGIPVPPLTSLLGLVLLWGVPMALTILLRDLGLVVLLNTILIVMLFAVAKRMGYLAIGLAGVAAVGFGLQFISSHAQARFDVWLNPFVDPTGKGWQILQGLTAMYSGGWWGSGLGTGSPETVPIVTSDFIYAALAEEIGFVGCALLLLIYATLFSRGFRAAGASRTPFERLLCVGLTASLAMQTLLNLAGVTKALPMTGITLPFISHGGSSLITCLFIAGLICGLSDND